MVFWIFRKKPHLELKKEVEGIHKRLHTSFFNIRQDMDEISEWLKDHDSHKEKLHNQFNLHKEDVQQQFDQLQHQIDTIFTLVEDLKEQNKLKATKKIAKIVEEPETDIEAELTLPNLDILTSTQKKIFKVFLAKIRETGRNKFTYRELAEELYPNKPYMAVRPTISSYLNHIEAFGLIQRKRIGQKMYVFLTDYGKQIINKLKTKSRNKRVKTK